VTKRNQKIAGVLVGLAIPAVLLFLVFSAAFPVVSGTVSSKGTSLGSWSSKLNDCNSSQPPELGADFDFPLPDAAPWHLALDGRSGELSELFLWKPGTAPTKLSAKNCASFKVTYESDNAKINGKRGKQGTVTFDCALEGGQFVGAFSYENCR
jgi:hypothetical protein